MRTASIIMPVHSDPAFNLRRRIIADVETQREWKLLVPEYDPKAPVFTVEGMLEILRPVDLVVADLSAARPSCYFELGFAEALQKRIQLVAEQGTEIHQTSGRDGVIYYIGLDGFRDALITALARNE